MQCIILHCEYENLKQKLTFAERKYWVSEYRKYHINVISMKYTNMGNLHQYKETY